MLSTPIDPTLECRASHHTSLVEIINHAESVEQPGATPGRINYNLEACDVVKRTSNQKMKKDLGTLLACKRPSCVCHKSVKLMAVSPPLWSVAFESRKAAAHGTSSKPTDLHNGPLAVTAPGPRGATCERNLVRRGELRVRCRSGWLEPVFGRVSWCPQPCIERCDQRAWVSPGPREATAVGEKHSGCLLSGPLGRAQEAGEVLHVLGDQVIPTSRGPFEQIDVAHGPQFCSRRHRCHFNAPAGQRLRDDR